MTDFDDLCQLLDTIHSQYSGKKLHSDKAKDAHAWLLENQEEYRSRDGYFNPYK